MAHKKKRKPKRTPSSKITIAYNMNSVIIKHIRLKEDTSKDNKKINNMHKINITLRYNWLQVL